MNLNISKQEAWMRVTVECTAQKHRQETDRCASFPRCPPLTCDTQPLAWNLTF